MTQEEISLELTQDNPFSTGVIVEYDDGTLSLESNNITIEPSSGDLTHEVIQGDTWSNIAYDKYSNSKLWHIITSNNPEYDSLDDPIPGTLLRIPDPLKVNF